MCFFSNDCYFDLKVCIVSIPSGNVFLMIFLASSFPANCFFFSLLLFQQSTLALVAYSIKPHILFNLGPEVQLAATA